MSHSQRVFATFLLTAAAIVVVAGIGPAQVKKTEEKKAEPARADVSKQKEAAIDNLKKAGLTKAIVVETEHFFVVGFLPAEKAKALGAALEKVVTPARKSLEYEAKDEVWKGKLAVYYFPESHDFKGFLRSAIMVRPEGVYYDVRSDVPFVVDPVDVPGKASESDLFSASAAVVAGAYLNARGSTANLPAWLLTGFGKVTAWRGEGLASRRYLAYKSQAKSLAVGGKGPPVAIADLWGDAKSDNSDVLAASLVEYMAYGPGAPNFLKLIYGFRPDENGNSPSVAQAFEAAGWKDMAVLEKAWQAWAAKGK